MINSQTLKTFVKMHEYKLNAKLDSLRASRLQDRLEHKLDKNMFDLDEESEVLDTRDDYSLDRFESPENRRRPKSHYFNFITS